MKEQEWDDVIGLACEEIYDDLPRDLVEEWLKNGNFPYTQWFVAEEKGEILGFIAWMVEDMYSEEILFEIAWMAVDEDSQRSGIGTKLIKDSWIDVKDSFSGFSVSITVVADEAGSKTFYREVLNPHFEAAEPKDRVRFYANLP